jgi:hypothetical protein
MEADMLAIGTSSWQAVGPIGTCRHSGRAARNVARGRHAAAGVRAAGGSELHAALARIEATFSAAMRHSAFKDRVAVLIRAGAGHPEARFRYRLLAERHPAANLDTAIIFVERLRRAELDRRERAIRTWGHCSRPRLGLMLLDELRLILRMVRRRAPARYPDLVAAVLGAGGAAQGGNVLTGEAAE